jgi:hypothetical protein
MHQHFRGGLGGGHELKHDLHASVLAISALALNVAGSGAIGAICPCATEEMSAVVQESAATAASAMPCPGVFDTCVPRAFITRSAGPKSVRLRNRYQLVGRL